MLNIWILFKINFWRYINKFRIINYWIIIFRLTFWNELTGVIHGLHINVLIYRLIKIRFSSIYILMIANITVINILIDGFLCYFFTNNQLTLIVPFEIFYFTGILWMKCLIYIFLSKNIVLPYRNIKFWIIMVVINL